MGHLVGDVAQPMHTDSPDREDRVHSLYEQAVDRLLPDYLFRYDGRAKAGPATRTRKVAQIAHRSYGELVRTYDRDGYNPRVHRITKRQLGSIPKAARYAPALARANRSAAFRFTWARSHRGRSTSYHLDGVGRAGRACAATPSGAAGHGRLGLGSGAARLSGSRRVLSWRCLGGGHHLAGALRLGSGECPYGLWTMAWVGGPSGLSTGPLLLPAKRCPRIRTGDLRLSWA